MNTYQTLTAPDSDPLGNGIVSERFSFDDAGHIAKAAILNLEPASSAAEGLHFQLSASLPRSLRRGASMRLAEATLTPLSDSAAQRLNDACYLGLSTWAKGEMVDVLNTPHGFGAVALDALCHIRPDIVACARLADRRGSSPLRLLVS